MSKIKNLIVGGCSFTAGCGFFKTELSPTPKDYHKNVEFAHEGLKKYFEEPFTSGNMKQQIEKLMYPTLLGEKLNVKNVKNLAVGGMGYPIHTRRIFSYLLNNQDKINFNETLVILQLTSLQRVELPTPKKDNAIHYCHIGDAGDGDTSAREYLINHYKPYYLILKGLYELSLFKGWCESMGIKIVFLDILGKVGFWKGEEIHMGQTPATINNHQYSMYHDYIRYPSIKDIVSSWNVVTIETKGYRFSDNGYHDDAHFVPEAHEDIAEKMYIELQKLLK